MEEETTLSRIGMYVTRGCLVVPVQVELGDDLALRLQQDVLKRVEETRVKGVVIDLSGVAIVDASLGRVIFGTARMASLLGAGSVITGFSAGVAASLIDLDFEPGDVLTAVSLENGLEILERFTGTRDQGSGEEFT